MITVSLIFPLSPDEQQMVRSLLGDEAPAPKQPKPTPVPEPEPEPEPELVGTGEPTLADAVARATALVSASKAAEVKAALEVAGVKRVSELAKPAAIKAFLDALDG